MDPTRATKRTQLTSLGKKEDRVGCVGRGETSTVELLFGSTEPDEMVAGSVSAQVDQIGQSGGAKSSSGWRDKEGGETNAL